VPPAAAPEQVADAQVAARVAVDGAPKEDVAGVALFIFLPFLRNEVGVGQQIVEDVSVHDGHVHQLLAELVALDGLAVLLTVGQIELDGRGVEDKLTALLVHFDFPAVGQEGVGVAVDDVGAYALSFDELGDFGLHATGRLAKPLEVVPSNAETVKKFHGRRDFAVRRFSDEVPHVGSPFSVALAGSPMSWFALAEKGLRISRFLLGRMQVEYQRAKINSTLIMYKVNTYVLINYLLLHLRAYKTECSQYHQ
jgi:hypothetical protein